MKIGLIGIGDIAKKAYLPTLTQTKDVELHLCSRSQAALEEASSAFSVNEIFTDREKWMKSGIEAAFVSTATDAHEEIIDDLLDHGIHVYIDKPITFYGTASKRLLAKAKDKNLILMVGFNRRYAPPYQALKEVPDPNMIIMQKNRDHQAADYRTFIVEDFIHVIDTLLYLFPYDIQNIQIRGMQKNGLVHHVVLELEAAEGTAIGIMNRNAGTTEEKVELMSESETRVVHNINDVATHQNKQIIKHSANDWEPMLQKRGFFGVIDAFINAVHQGGASYTGYERDAQRHDIAEQMVQKLMKEQ